MNASKQHAPRSGGRTAEQEHQTVGNTALKAESVSAAPGGAPRERKVVPWLRVAPPLPVAVPRAPFIALILVVVVGGVLGILVVNTKINENAFRLSELREQQSTLDVQEQQLKQEIARAEDPGNLTARARTLGLVEGTPVQIRLPDGRVVGMMTPATKAPSNASQQGAGDQATGDGQQAGTGQQGTGNAGTGTGNAGTGTGTGGQPAGSTGQQGTGTNQQPTE